MKPLTIAVPFKGGALFEKGLSLLAESGLVERILVISRNRVSLDLPRCTVIAGGPLTSKNALDLILGSLGTEYFLLLSERYSITMETGALEKMLEAARSRGAGMVYSDFYEEAEKGKSVHPLNDYLPGSVRDDFDFGPAMVYSVSAVRRALEKYEPTPPVEYAGLYDLRLKVSIDHGLLHLKEPLYSVGNPGAKEGGGDDGSTGEEIFAYVDPRNREAQKEMEEVFTEHLRRIGAYLPAPALRKAGPVSRGFPVEASVIIPVRNRRGTIADAVGSAISQETDFPFNVIVVDNHSTDGTTAILSDLTARHSALTHIVPLRRDLGIGGCWNEALHSEACGRYAVQLDSDDLYRSPRTLQRIVHLLREGDYAMVVGSYTIVDFALNQIPPGLIDHREWTDENGHNNALRINGLGAPRAFNTEIMGSIGFLNVSYGEDYAAALRISREYRIGRIYESLYLCRRWPGNTDAGISLEQMNRNNAFKDEVRTAEIRARQKMNSGG